MQRAGEDGRAWFIGRRLIEVEGRACYDCSVRENSVDGKQKIIIIHKQLIEDLERLGEILEAAKSNSLEYLLKLNEVNTSATFENDSPDNLPEIGYGALGALEKFIEKYQTIIVSSSGPRFWGYATGVSTPASIVGDWLATVYDQNAQAIKGAGDTSANIELQTIEMLLDLFQLSDGEFWGSFVTGATMSSFTCLGVARQWYGKEKGLDIAKNGMKKCKIFLMS